MKTNRRRGIAKRGRAKQARPPALTIAAAPSKSNNTIYIACASLALLTFLVYSPAIFHPFVNYDDYDYVTQNPHVQAGLSLHTMSWALTSTELANWHPLTWISHVLDFQLYGLNPVGHHLTNVLLHSANVALLFLILFRATGATWRSAFVAALFGLHPLNVESVAWVAERKNVLSMFFFLVTLISYGRYTRKPTWRSYTLVAVTFALGLAAKPMLVTLPFVLMLVDYWPLCRIEGWTHASPDSPMRQSSWPHLLLEKVPLIALSAASSLVTMFAQREYGTVRALPWSIRLGNAAYSYCEYLIKFLWPVHLAVVYPHPLNRLSTAAIFSSFLFLVAITGVAWRWRKRHPYVIVGWLWFLGTLVPVIGTIQVGDQGMADRYMYLPMVGILVALVWGFMDLARANSWLERPLLTAIKAASIAILIGLAVLSIRQIGFWRSSFDLWNHALQVTEHNFVADDRMASLLLAQGRIEDANRYFKDAALTAPWDPISHLALGAAAQDRGDLREAIRDFQVALGAKSSNFRTYAYTNLAILHRQLGDNVEWRQEAQHAMSDDPAAVHGMIRQQQQTLQANPSAAGYLRLGMLLEVAGQVQDAQAAFEHALSLDPNFTPAAQALRTENLIR
jgi:protein O-mannosyl-transferase